MRKHLKIRYFLVFCLLLEAAAPLSAADSPAEVYSLENPSLCYRLELRDGGVKSRSFINHLTGKVVSLPTEEFLLEFQDGLTVGSSDCTAKLSWKQDASLEILFTRKEDARPAIEVRVEYTLPADKPYLRKQISVRRKKDSKENNFRLMRADLENWRGCRQLWDSLHADRLPYASHPIFCEDLWAGVEFVAAFNEYSREGFVLRSRPGGKSPGTDWMPLRSTVVGAAPRDRVERAFLRYLEDIRLSPPRFVSCYNTWWTFFPPVKEGELLDLARQLKERMFDKYGEFFDVFATDEGWADRQTIWELNRKMLPRGFTSLREIIEPAGCRLGLWISPSALYPNSTDYEWAFQNGYKVIGKDGSKVTEKQNTRRGISLADPRYHEKTIDALSRLIRENRLQHVKFDGFIARENDAHDGLLPGDDSVEPLAQQALALMKAAKEANPALVCEPTFLNSLANYISPWMIQYADSVWGNSGGDCPRAIGPAPDYRESCTNAREWYIFSARKEIWLPQNALQFFDIVHCDAAGGFVNHAAMAVGRGRFFLPVYANPKYMGDGEFEFLAGLLRWAKNRQTVLRETVMLPSKVEQGEPYAYAHWSDKCGIVAVRNPSNESRSYALDLRAAGAPADLDNAVCYSQFPYRKGFAAGANSDTILPLRLAPWELIFVEIVPRNELREPIALAARWYPDDEGKMQVAPDTGVKKVQVLFPGSADVSCEVTVEPASRLAGKLISRTVTEAAKDGWLKVADKSRPTADFDIACEVSIPEGASGTVLLLLEYPGKNHLPSLCSAAVNNEKTPLEESSSKGHIGGPLGNINSFWSGEIPYTSEWTWYLCPVSAGKSKVQFRGSVAMPEARMGLWVWSKCDRSADLQKLHLPCSQPEMPQHRDRVERQGICILSPTG